mmetsp:Transcript_45904/g.144006  ORF Transcript_45904/g.144006 Transcript_45904/m.144006 type:complete len:447 (-) Transcript_45904:811-2151(-)
MKQKTLSQGEKKNTGRESHDYGGSLGFVCRLQHEPFSSQHRCRHLGQHVNRLLALVWHSVPSCRRPCLNTGPDARDAGLGEVASDERIRGGGLGRSTGRSVELRPSELEDGGEGGLGDVDVGVDDAARLAGARRSVPRPDVASYLHLLSEPHEFQPVVLRVHHMLPQPQVRERRDAPTPMRALPDDLLEALPVEAGESVLSCVQAACTIRRPPRVLHEVDRGRAGPVRQVLVLHLKAREVEHHPMLRKHLSDGFVAVALASVEVSSRQLRRMALSLAAPVDPCNLGSQEDVGALERPPCSRKNLVPMPKQRVGVPFEEERTGLSLPQPVVLEEFRMLRGVVVVADLIRMRGPGKPPLGLLSTHGCSDQISPHVLVVALELTDAGEVPEGEGVGGVAQLSCRPEADLSLDDNVGDEVSKGGGEAVHEVLVHVQRRSPIEDLLLICSK